MGEGHGTFCQAASRSVAHGVQNCPGSLCLVLIWWLYLELEAHDEEDNHAEDADVESEDGHGDSSDFPSPVRTRALSKSGEESDSDVFEALVTALEASQGMFALIWVTV